MAYRGSEESYVRAPDQMGRGNNGGDTLSLLGQATDRTGRVLERQGAEETQNIRDWYAGLGKIAPGMVEGYQKGETHGADMRAADQTYASNEQTMAANKLKMDTAARINAFKQQKMANGMSYEEQEAAMPAQQGMYASEEHPLQIHSMQTANAAGDFNLSHSKAMAPGELKGQALGNQLTAAQIGQIGVGNRQTKIGMALDTLSNPNLDPATRKQAEDGLQALNPTPLEVAAVHSKASQNANSARMTASVIQQGMPDARADQTVLDNVHSDIDHLTKGVGFYDQFHKSGDFSDTEKMTGQQLAAELEAVNKSAAEGFRSGYSVDPTGKGHVLFKSQSEKASEALKSQLNLELEKVQTVKNHAANNPQVYGQAERYERDILAQLAKLGTDGAAQKPRNVQLTGGSVPATQHNATFISGQQGGGAQALPPAQPQQNNAALLNRTYQARPQQPVRPPIPGAAGTGGKAFDDTALRENTMRRGQ